MLQLISGLVYQLTDYTSSLSRLSNNLTFLHSLNCFYILHLWQELLSSSSVIATNSFKRSLMHLTPDFQTFRRSSIQPYKSSTTQIFFQSKHL